MILCVAWCWSEAGSFEPRILRIRVHHALLNDHRRVLMSDWRRAKDEGRAEMLR
jgi:hypothetical protein